MENIKNKANRQSMAGAKYNAEIDREPFLATFIYNNKQFTVATFHAITKSNQPNRNKVF
jgi:hypothetical protein